MTQWKSSRGKGAVLALLRENGIPVFDGYSLDFSDTEITETVLNEVWIFLCQHMQLPLIIRSWNENEDSKEHSFAGCFFSSGPVFTEPEFSDSVKKVLSETPESLYYTLITGEESGLKKILVQPWVDFKVTGVVFYSSDTEVFQVECGKGDSVTTGNDLELKQNLSENIMSDLKKSVKKISDITSFSEIDVEFGVDSNDKIIILQARPLKGFLKAPMQKGLWNRDKKYNPEPVSFFHESLIETINHLGFTGISTYFGFIYYSETGSIEKSINSSENEPGLSGVESSVYEFCEFAKEYMTKSGSAPAGGTNVIAATVNRLREKKEIACDNDLVDELMKSDVSLLPLRWDIASPVLRDNRQLLYDFVSTYNPLVECSEISHSEMDDIDFAIRMYRLRSKVLDRANYLKNEGVFQNVDDVFTLPHKTVFSIIPDGVTDVLIPLKGIQRKADCIPPDTFIGGTARYTRIKFYDDVYHGKTVVPGMVRGRIEKYTPGKKGTGGAILVAFALAPQDIVFITGCAGLVIETGTPLSHGAILARELGIPSICSIENISSLLSDGDEIILNATEGFVHREKISGDRRL